MHTILGYRGNRPTNTLTNTVTDPQTEPITIHVHYDAKLSMQCTKFNNNNNNNNNPAFSSQ